MSIQELETPSKAAMLLAPSCKPATINPYLVIRFCLTIWKIYLAHTRYLSILVHRCANYACKSTPQSAYIRDKIAKTGQNRQKCHVLYPKKYTSMKKVHHRWLRGCDLAHWWQERTTLALLSEVAKKKLNAILKLYQVYLLAQLYLVIHTLWMDFVGMLL